MKKIICFTLAMLLCLSLAACGHTHTWQDATCLAPKTCIECNATEGEVLDHTWQEATCLAPKTCSVCGQTEGDSLSHTWQEATCESAKICINCGTTEGEAFPHDLTEANYQEPAYCKLCGAVEGDVLTPYFEENGFEINVKVGEPLPYRTICANNPDKTTLGQFAVTDYQVFSSDENHPAKDGYEWRIAEVKMTFNDDNAYWNSVQWNGILVDYYDKGSLEGDPLGEEDGLLRYTLNSYYGEPRDAYVRMTTLENQWVQHDLTVRISFELLVPEGYDGIVVGAYDKSVCMERGEGEEALDYYTSPEDFLLFRMS